jgi:hypothetical protein
MVAGSSAYINSVSSTAGTGLVIPRSYSTEFTTNTLEYTVEHLHPNSPFYVREDGIYSIFFSITDDGVSQWTTFVNGKAVPSTTVGTNSGAGQVNSRQMLALRKNDGLLIRNFTSTSNAVTTVPYAGGELVGTDASILLFKIAPLCLVPKDNECEKKCHKHKKLYKKLLEKMLCDKELMLRGFDVHGDFYSNVSYSYFLGDDVKFDMTNNVSGLEMMIGVNPSGSESSLIKVSEEGIYDLVFFIDTTTACQFTMCVNGVPIETTTKGTNRGSGQLTLHSLLALNAGDIVSVRNWKSNTAKIITQEGSGGNLPAMNTNLVIFKCAPLVKPSHQHPECHIPEHYMKCYEEFREFLLHNDKLQVAGSPVFLSTVLNTYQQILLNDSIDFDYNVLTRDAVHIPGHSKIVVEHDGIYNLYVDLITDEPAQITVFVNGVPELNTTTGRDSGSTRVILRQLIKLKCGDELSVRNYQSNPGGNEPGNAASFMIFRLSHNNRCVHPEMPKKEKEIPAAPNKKDKKSTK